MIVTVTGPGMAVLGSGGRALVAGVPSSAVSSGCGLADLEGTAGVTGPGSPRVYPLSRTPLSRPPQRRPFPSSQTFLIPAMLDMVICLVMEL